MKKYNKGSAIIAIIVTAIVFVVYTTSTYTDILHLKTMHEKYFSNIVELYEKDYNVKISDI